MWKPILRNSTLGFFHTVGCWYTFHVDLIIHGCPNDNHLTELFCNYKYTTSLFKKTLRKLQFIWDNSCGWYTISSGAFKLIDNYILWKWFVMQFWRLIIAKCYSNTPGSWGQIQYFYFIFVHGLNTIVTINFNNY